MVPCAFRQNLDKDQNLEKQINSFYIEIKQRIPPKEFLLKKSSLKNPSEKLPKNFKKNSKKFPKNPNNSEKIFKQSLKKFLRF